MSEDIGQSVPVGQLSRLLMLTDTRVQQLSKQGVIVKSGRGEYRLVPSIQGYIKFLQHAAKNGGGDEEGQATEGSYGKHRARLYKARADKAEVEAGLIKGTAHDAGAVARVWADMINNARVKLLALPTTLASQIEGMTIQERQETIQLGVNEALRELAEYSPEIVTQQYVATHSDEPQEIEPEDDDEPEE